MKRKILNFGLIAIASLFVLSCNKDDNSSANVALEYPITLTFKETGEATLEYWKGGSLTVLNPNEFTNYFDTQSCLNYFNEETDLYCKQTKLVFLNENKLKFSYNGEDEFELNYHFVNDTLKFDSEGSSIALGVENRERLIIYGNLNKFKSTNRSGCGGDEFFKFNFDGQYFLSARPNHDLPFNSPEEMEPNDEVYFYNLQYILTK